MILKEKKKLNLKRNILSFSPKAREGKGFWRENLKELLILGI